MTKTNTSDNTPKSNLDKIEFHLLDLSTYHLDEASGDMTMQLKLGVFDETNKKEDYFILQFGHTSIGILSKLLGTNVLHWPGLRLSVECDGFPF